ncbi:MAG TPA: transglycosylase domain-containing protein [Thermoanaerobaculia bacterium]
MRRKALVIIAILVIVAPFGAVWWLVRDELAIVRADAAVAPKVPAQMKAALIASEGPIFDTRPQSFVVNPFRGRNLVSGGATAATVLARWTTPRRRMLRWHLETALVAFAISREFSGDEVLRVYAHRAYLGRGIEGVEQASRAYFAKPASSLTFAEAATIAGMVRSPHYLSPVNHPDRALDRRNKVLKRMRELRSITEQQYRDSVREELRVNPALRISQQAGR